MKHLKDYMNESIINVNTPFTLETHYDNIFKKMDIYNRNVKLINEGKYNSLPTYIPYSEYEQEAISEMLFGIQFNFLHKALEDVYNFELNEGLADIGEKMKNALSEGKEAFSKYIKELINKIPNNTKEIYNKLGEIAERGISNVKEFFNKIHKLFKLIGDNLNDVLEKLGLYKDEVIADIPETKVENSIISEILPDDKNKQKLINFIISQVNDGVNNKDVVRDFSLRDDVNEDINEGIGRKIAVGGLTFGLFAAPGATLLILGTIIATTILYKTTKGLGKFLSKNLEPILLSDKVKKTVEKMYNNKIVRYGLGLRVSDKTNEEMSGFRKFLKLIHSVIINVVIAGVLSYVITLVVGFALKGIVSTLGISLIVTALIAGKNIFTTIANRILNFKKVKKSESQEETYFFDFMTMFSILLSIMTFLWKIPAVKEWFGNLWEKICQSDFGPNCAKAAERAGKNGFYDDSGNFVKVKDFDDYILTKHEGVTYVMDPKNNMYCTMTSDGRLEPITQENFGKLADALNSSGKAVHLPDMIDSFGSNFISGEKTDILHNIKNWSGSYITSETSYEFRNACLQNMSADKLKDLGTQLSESCYCSIQFATTTDGNIFANVVMCDNVNGFKEIISDGAQQYFSSTGKEQWLNIIFNVKEVGVEATIDGVGAQYDAFDVITKNTEIMEKIKDYALKYGAKSIKTWLE